MFGFQACLRNGLIPLLSLENEHAAGKLGSVSNGHEKSQETESFGHLAR